VQLVGNDGGGPGSVRLASAAGRWVLAMVLLEATVVNVALPLPLRTGPGRAEVYGQTTGNRG
jgi:hypothetical protein